MTEAQTWRRCSSCKSPIGFETTYWVCNVSTCNRKRTGLVFCSVSCWDAHLPLMRHRDSWAEELCSPTAAQWAAEKAGESAPREKGSAAAGRAAGAPRAAPSAATGGVVLRKSGGVTRRRSESRSDEASEILVVASKVKAYIREQSGFSTSDRVLLILSEKVRRLCDRGIRNARTNEQKTVMGRDIP